MLRINCDHMLMRFPGVQRRTGAVERAQPMAGSARAALASVDYGNAPSSRPLRGVLYTKEIIPFYRGVVVIQISTVSAWQLPRFPLRISQDIY